MMSNILDEGNLQFDFSGCGAAERFDLGNRNPYGMKSVDFITETDERLYFIEVKDFQNPNATDCNKRKDYEMLVSAVKEPEKSIFNIEMGEKIKDSLLRRYAEGNSFTKKVVYLLLIHLDKLGKRERGKLKERISGYVPTGLNKKGFNAFHEISFDLVNVAQLKKYGIECSVKQ